MKRDPGETRWCRVLLQRQIIPDPGGWVGLALVVGVVLSHLLLPGEPTGCLFSQNLFLEILGHAWLLLGPPVALYLGIRQLLLGGGSALSLLTVPLAFFLTLTTGVAVVLGTVMGGP